MKFEIFTREDLKELAGNGHQPRVSILMPANSEAAGGQENRIRFKNLVGKQAQKELEELLGKEAGDFLSPARELLDDPLFWNRQGQGLAVYVGRTGMHAYKLPMSVAEVAHVGPRFLLRPLLELLSDDGRFYILAVSGNQTRLLECSPRGAVEVDVEDLPENQEAALFEELEQQLQFHTGTASSQGGRRRAMFHGQGVGTDDAKDRLRRYFMAIDKAIAPVVGDDLLILSGVSYLFPIYREASKLKNVREEGLAGNPEERSVAELHADAVEMLAPEMNKARDALARYTELVARGLTSDDTDTIMRASRAGRIDTLFVKRSARVWGRFSEEDNQAEIHAERQPGDEELMDMAATLTAVGGGKVFALADEDMPGEYPAAAMLRY